MKVTYDQIEGLVVITPNIFRDVRGFFLETFSRDKYVDSLPLGTSFVQDNMSYSVYGTIRGLHFQIEPYAQAKLVRCVYGKIWDVAVDIRPGSNTYGKFFAIVLSFENQRQLFIPKGFAHGFAVLSTEAIVEYKCDNPYNHESERGIIYDDPDLHIPWPISEENRVMSTKDLKYPKFIDSH